MELVLVRHALPVRRELLEGRADPELSADGEAQVRHLTDYLATEEIDAIYSSPLRRAVQTVEPLAARLGLDVTLVDGVSEWDRNSAEYIPIEEMRAMNHPRWQAMQRGEWDDQEESQDEFRTRVISAVEDIVTRHPEQRVVVSCHGGVLNAYLVHVLGLGDRQGFFYPNYTSINRVVASRTGRRMVMTVNETSHLRHTGLPIGLYQK